MTKQSSIKYISSLLNDPATITDSDKGSMASLRQTYPYFVPMRYLEALDRHKKIAYSPEMLSAVKPYVGDWMMFCEFLEKGIVKMKVVASSGTVKDIVPVPEEQTEASEAAPVTPATIPEPQAEEVLPVPEPDHFAQLIGEVDEEEMNKVLDKKHVEVQPEEPQQPKSTHWIVDEEVVAAAKALIEDQEEQVPVVQPAATQVNPEQEAEYVIAEVVQDHQAALDDVATDMALEAELHGKDTDKEKPLINPVYTEDYFLQQGLKISPELPDEISELRIHETTDEEDEAARSLMVMMSFSEWLLHFKNTTEKQKEETKDQRALKTMWQKEKLAAAMEEENEEIPENVFEMAVNSIAKEEGLASESLAEIYMKQEKYDKAIDMYRKLSLRDPKKSAYFARKIEEIQKDKQL